MSSSCGSRRWEPRCNSASTWMGWGAVFSDSRIPRLASKRNPVSVRVWVPVVLLIVEYRLHQGKIALKAHQVLAAVHQQRGAGDGLVLQGKEHGGRHVLRGGGTAQR